MNIKSIVLNIEDLTENVIGMKNFAYVNCAKNMNRILGMMTNQFSETETFDQMDNYLF